MSTDQLLTVIDKVRAARDVVRNLGHRVKSKEAEHNKAHAALALAESELREVGTRLGIRVTVIDPELERNGEQVCARTLRGYRNPQGEI